MVIFVQPKSEKGINNNKNKCKDSFFMEKIHIAHRDTTAFVRPHPYGGTPAVFLVESSSSWNIWSTETFIATA